jgi:DNA-binding transcriptional regulator YhcF (GntR family)
MGLRKRQREAAERLALERLRGRILSGIHGGHLNPGDRLPGYREISAQAGIDLRAVGRVYDALGREGLVEIRSKTGVYVATQERIGGRVLAETARWVMRTLVEGWRRRVPIHALPDLIRRCVSTAMLRCACIESTEDQLIYLCRELRQDFGLDTAPIRAAQILTEAGVKQPRLPAELRRADLLVTTTFHAAEIRPIATEMEKPLITIRLNPDYTRIVERHLDEHELTVVCIDPLFADRVRAVFGSEHPERIQMVLASDWRAIARLDPGQPVLISRAAREKLHGIALPPPLVPPGAPVIAPDTAAELIETVLRFNLDALRSDAHS